jgi:hypothetical protein
MQTVIFLLWSGFCSMKYLMGQFASSGVTHKLIPFQWHFCNTDAFFNLEEISHQPQKAAFTPESGGIPQIVFLRVGAPDDCKSKPWRCLKETPSPFWSFGACPTSFSLLTFECSEWVVIIATPSHALLYTEVL